MCVSDCEADAKRLADVLHKFQVTNSARTQLAMKYCIKKQLKTATEKNEIGVKILLQYIQ